MATCHDVAKYFLSKSDPEIGDFLSHLKLQKLVYYAQGFSLAILNRPLFQEELRAWDHGPVVPELYHSYKEYGAGPIPKYEDEEYLNSIFTKEERELLDEVNFVYGQFSAWKLRNMTHEEKPWQEAYDDDLVISHESLKNFFVNLVEEDE